MIEAYRQGKDLYATIATGIYKNGYWDNMEHYEDGTPNPEGKKRRKKVKGLLLGIMYSMGSASLAESIKSTKEEAQKIIDDFYAGFPKVAKWIESTNKFAKDNGYVEDLWGRRRRLPDILLPQYELKFKNNKLNVSNSNFNPLLHCSGLVIKEKSPLIGKYEKQLAKCKSRKDVSNITSKALAEGVLIKNNGGFIAQAERQCVNARVQGSAATMSKKAMINVYNDDILNKLGFKLLIAVHDELIGECPEENAEQVADRLTEVMKTCALPIVSVPFKCDPTVERSWAETDCKDAALDEYKELIAQGKTEEEAFEIVYQSRTEFSELQIKEMLELI